MISEFRPFHITDQAGFRLNGLSPLNNRSKDGRRGNPSQEISRVSRISIAWLRIWVNESTCSKSMGGESSYDSANYLTCQTESNVPMTQLIALQLTRQTESNVPIHDGDI